MGKVIKAFRRRNAKRHYPSPFGLNAVLNQVFLFHRSICGLELEPFRMTTDYAKLTCKRCKKMARKVARDRGQRSPHRG